MATIRAKIAHLSWFSIRFQVPVPYLARLSCTGQVPKRSRRFQCHGAACGACPAVCGKCSKAAGRDDTRRRRPETVKPFTRLRLPGEGQPGFASCSRLAGAERPGYGRTVALSLQPPKIGRHHAKIGGHQASSTESAVAKMRGFPDVATASS
jgi:hypothetical protein